MTISVNENPDGTFTIDWDHEHPQESILNDWTEEDFTNYIRTYCEKLIAEADDPDNVGFSVEEALQERIEEEQKLNQTQGYIRKDDEDERLPRLFF